MTVMIGVDPHKGSHTAVAVDETEQALGELKVRSGPAQLERLLAWAQRFPARSWAVENATGLGYLVAQQLVGAGERVIDVQPKLGARVRLLDNQAVNKNDPHDARSVAIAALRSRTPVEVRTEDHSAVAKLWSKRQRDLARARNKTACRLHSLLCELVPRGVPDEIYAAKAAKLLASVSPDSAVTAARVSSPGSCWTTCAASTPRSRSRKGGSPRWSRRRGPRPPGSSAWVRWSPPLPSGSRATSPASQTETTSPPSMARPPSTCPPEAGRSTGCPGVVAGTSTTPSTWRR